MLVELHGDADPSLIEVLFELAALNIDQGYVEDAIGVFQRTIEILESAYGPDDDDVVETRRLLAILTEPDDRDEKAREVLRSTESAYGRHHPRTADASSLLGKLLIQLGRYDEARRMMDRALEIDRGNTDRITSGSRPVSSS